jgi:signal transduction histidine kinase
MPPDWRDKRRYLFWRFAGFFVFITLVFVVVMGGLAFLLTYLFGGDSQTAISVWLAGCGLVLLVPLLLWVVLIRPFRRMVDPLAQVMAAADAVAEGDLDVRVKERGPGELRQLAHSFNRMVSELQRADRLRRDMMADVAHELRNPLHVLQGNLEGLQDGLYQPTPEKIDALLDETRQLSRLVEDLGTLSLAEAGQLHLAREVIEVNDLFADVATSFSGQAEAAGIALTVEHAPGSKPLTVLGDAGRLDQVLGNLVANALQHTQPGGRITLRAEAIPGGARLQVSDDGEGIPAEDLPHIFDRFWRGNRDQDGERPRGSGLGLAIARQLVESHAGVISVESQPGQGANFTIELPAGTEEKGGQM